MNDWVEHLGRSFGNFTSDFIDALETRAALFAEEWRQERRRSLIGALVACLAAGSLFISLIGFMGAYILTLPPSEQAQGLLIAACILFALGLAGFLLLWWIVARARPFQFTLEEVRKDSRCLLDAVRRGR